MATPKAAAYNAMPIKFGDELTDPQQILDILKLSFAENDEDNSGGLVSSHAVALCAEPPCSSRRLMVANAGLGRIGRRSHSPSRRATSKLSSLGT